MDKILIIGTGALANLFGAQLSKTGMDVMLLGTWEEGVKAIREHGIRLASPEGEVVYPARAVKSPAEVGQARYALVLVKSWQTQRAARQLFEILDPEGVALSLQNGLGNRELIADQLGEKRAAQGVTTMGATLLGPGHVRPGGEGIISVEDHPLLPPLIAGLKKAGFKVEIAPDVDSLIWRKLLINVAINPLTAIFGVPNGKLLESQSALDLMALAVREVEKVAGSRGIKVGFDDPLAYAEDVARRTASNRSSMLQDISRGAPTEIEAMCGAVVRAGQEKDISTPINQVLTYLVKSLVELKKEHV
ncbi:MAG: 2-dehydropantoate 2-reductase [Anaerolineales bacterium]